MKAQQVDISTITYYFFKVKLFTGIKFTPRVKLSIFKKSHDAFTLIAGSINRSLYPSVNSSSFSLSLCLFILFFLQFLIFRC